MKDAAPLYRLIGLALGALPDSIADRKAILLDILALIPRRHPLRGAVVEMLNFLEAHEKHQLNLALDFKNQSAAAADGDDDGHHKSEK